MLFLLQILAMFLPANETTSPQTIFQLLLNTERLEMVIKKGSSADKRLPVIIVTNGHLPTDAYLTMFGEEVKVFKTKEESDLIKNGHSFINLTKSTFNSDKGEAEFTMLYNKRYIKARFERIEDVWTFKYLYHKHRSKRFLDFNFK